MNKKWLQLIHFCLLRQQLFFQAHVPFWQVILVLIFLKLSFGVYLLLFAHLLRSAIKIGLRTKLTARIAIDLKNAANPWFVRNFNNIFGCVTKVLDTILTTTNRNSNIIQLAKRNWHVSLFLCRNFGRIKTPFSWHHMVSDQTAGLELPVVFGRVLHDQIAIIKPLTRRQLSRIHVLDINGWKSKASIFRVGSGTMITRWICLRLLSCFWSVADCAKAMTP